MRWLSLLPLLSACESTPTDSSDDLGVEPVCTEEAEVVCDLSADLPFVDAVSEGEVTTTTDGNDWVTTVDARAGGFLEASNNPWVYVRFGDSGPEKVDLTDPESLTSMDWDLALHRFNIRLNSGAGGPSCVRAGAASGTYAALDVEAASEVALSEEDFYDASCVFREEDSEEEGAPTGVPSLLLRDWWTYPDCVATTETPFVVQTASGRLVKLVVESYYRSGQETCNEEGRAGGDSALITFRWTWLQ